MRFVFSFLLCVFTGLSAQDLTLSTLNCCWCFLPDNQAGQVRTGDKVTTNEEFSRKIDNLASMLTRAGVEFAGLQELGGEAELRSLSGAVGQSLGVAVDNAFAKGRDTYTGQDVGAFLCRQPGRWTIKECGRVPSLERLLSKHLLVSLYFANGKVINVLVVHLIRPIASGKNKHEAQIAGICQWAQESFAARPDQGFVIAGDTNSQDLPPSPFSMSGWLDAFTRFPCPTTHIGGRGLYDRIVVSPNLQIGASQLTPPTLPARANETLRRVWTDHFLVSARVNFK